MIDSSPLGPRIEANSAGVKCSIALNCDRMSVGGLGRSVARAWVSGVRTDPKNKDQAILDKNLIDKNMILIKKYPAEKNLTDKKCDLTKL